MTVDKDTNTKNRSFDSAQDDKEGRAQNDTGGSAQGNSGVRIGGEQSSSPWGTIKKKLQQKPVYVAGAILLIAASGWVLIASQSNKNVYAEVDGHKIYKEDVQELIKNNEDASERDGAEVLADKYLTEAMGKEQGVKVSDEDVAGEYPNIADIKTGDPYAYQNIINQAYFRKLSANHYGTYKGKLLVGHFSGNVAYESPLLAEKKAKNPNLGNPAVIAADKKYAYDFIKNLRDQIQSKKITFEQAIEAEKADPRIGENSQYSTVSHSGPFDATLADNGLMHSDAVKKKLETLKLGNVSEPFVVRSSNSMEDDSTAETHWLVVQLDERSGGGQDGDFETALERAKKQLGYKINV